MSELVEKEKVLKLLSLGWQKGIYPYAEIKDLPPADAVMRQEAIDAIMGEHPDAHYPAWYADIIRKL